LIYPKHAFEFSEEETRLLQRECRAMSRVNSPFVVKLIDTVSTPRVFGIVMEYLDGESLDSLIDANEEDGRPAMSEAEALACCKDILQGLSATHAQALVHRDIKPGNIIRVREGGKHRHVLIDFGIAAVTEASESNTAHSMRRSALRTMGASLAGTPAYMPPEAIRDIKSVDARSDLYSLGASLFHLVSGRLPFEGENGNVMMSYILTTPTPTLLHLSNVLNFSCSAGFSEFVEKAMNRDMQVRMRSCCGKAAYMIHVQDCPARQQRTDLLLVY
jgi:serine/threonine protein kinase